MRLHNFICFPLLQNISPKLLPLKGVESREGNLWESINNDPQFVLRDMRLKLLSGWVSVEVDIETDVEIHPKLYFNFGEGYRESDAILMIPVLNGGYRAEFVLPKIPLGIRFDPSEEPLFFSLSKFRIQVHSEILHTLHRFMAIAKNDFYEEKGVLRIFRKSYARFRKHGYTGMLDRLEKEYGVLYPQTVFKNSTHHHDAYRQWIAQNELPAVLSDTFAFQPLISVVVPVYNTPVPYLKACIESVLAQYYTRFELCIADDASSSPETKELLESYRDHPKIKMVFRKENGHISKATNSVLKIASGDYIAFLDHDDMLAKNALWEVVSTLNRYRHAKLLYSDEDKIDESGRRYEPHFKSAWNRDMFFSQNYLSHLCVVQKEFVERVGGLRPGYEGAQDYDLILRLLEEIKNDEIIHIAKILYHWRAISGSTAQGAKEKRYTTAAGIHALQDFFKVSRQNVTVEKGLLDNTYKVSYLLPEEPPLVSLLIPTRDGYDILSKCIASILEKTVYSNYEIIILDNETTDPRTLDYFKTLEVYTHIRVLKYPYPFNYSAINNFGVRHANGTLVGLLNNDVEIISAHWLTEMVQHAIRPEIGAVGAKLYYDNDTVQHAGIILGIGGVAGHSHKYFRKDAHGYFSRLKIIQNLSAVTSACLVVRKEIYEEVGGMNEANLKVAFNDVDFCLKIREKGYRNLWTPYVELYHHESVSRGAEDSKEKRERFAGEIAYMQNEWGKQLLEDPYYNRHLTLDHENFMLWIGERNIK